MKTHVPPLSLDGDVIGYGTGAQDPEFVTVMAPEYYMSSDALLILADSRLGPRPSCTRLDLPIDAKGHFRATIDEEDRYIGFPVLFPPIIGPSKKKNEMREFFMALEGGDCIYRVSVEGNSATVQRTSLLDVQRRLRDLIQECEIAAKNRDRDFSWAEEEIKFYENTKWCRAEEVVAVVVNRSSNIDSIILKVARHCQS
ncbi:MAG: hypothetical protein AB1898_32880 [Acidobacteriota bacterium]